MIKITTITALLFLCLTSVTRLYAEYSVIGEEIAQKGQKKEYLVETLDGHEYKGKIKLITTEKLIFIEKGKKEPIEIRIRDIRKIEDAKDKSNTVMNAIAVGGIVFITYLFIGIATLK